MSDIPGGGVVRPGSVCVADLELPICVLAINDYEKPIQALYQPHLAGRRFLSQWGAPATKLGEFMLNCLFRKAQGKPAHRRIPAPISGNPAGPTNSS